MQKKKRLALLSFLSIVSIGLAIVAQMSGVLGSLASVFGENEINIQLTSSNLSPEDREKATKIVLMDTQIQDLLKDAYDFSIEVNELFDIHEINGGIALVPKEGFAIATLKINKDYGEEFGVQVVKVTINLLNEEITETEVNPEIRKQKVHEDPISPSELIQNPSEYDGVIVTVSGEVSVLGEVFGYLFVLDETVTVFYRHEEANVDVSNIENGDYVKVTGKFCAPDTIYALEIEKM